MLIPAFNSNIFSLIFSQLCSQECGECVYCVLWDNWKETREKFIIQLFIDRIDRIDIEPEMRDKSITKQYNLSSIKEVGVEGGRVKYRESIEPMKNEHKHN